MSVPPNIDRFNKVTLLLFDTLYLAFPVPCELSVSKIAVDTLATDATFDESFKSNEPVYHAIEFLRKEGFIECADSTLDGNSFFQARLTIKSLALLGQTPSMLEPQVSVSDKIRSVVKGGLKEASSEAAKKAVELLFSYAPSLFSVGQAVVSSGP